MTSQEDEKLLTISEVAKWLNLSRRSMYRYIDAGMFENVVIIPRGKRRYCRFSRACKE